MRQSNLVIEKHVNQAIIGTWISPPKGISIPMSAFCPYLKGPEDMEVLMRNAAVLAPMQPVELCGITAQSMMRKAYQFDSELRIDVLSKPYHELSKEHPIFVSFSSEFIWTGSKPGISAFQKEMSDGLSKAGLGMDAHSVDFVANQLKALASESQNNMTFWDEILTRTYERMPLTRIIIEWAIKAAIRCRASAMSGFVPIIDKQSISSINNAHKMNLAYADRMAESTESRTPLLFYGLELNPSMFKADNFSGLDKIISNASLGLSLNLFDGVALRIRGLRNMSSDPGRINTAIKFVKELSSTCRNDGLPLWWSLSGLPGLTGLDNGVSFASMRINASSSDDLFYGGSAGDEESKFGKVLNTNRKETWGLNQVERGLQLGLLPEHANFDLDALRPTILYNNKRYRLEFSKPYNMAAIAFLHSDWIRQTRAGEVCPGGSYLKDFIPFGAWGANI